MEETAENPLQVKVVVRGSGGAVDGATVDATLFLVTKIDEDDDPTPHLDLLSSTTKTGVDGSALLTFPTFDATESGYSIIAQVELSGLTGIGFYSNEESDATSESLIVPVITSYERGEIGLYHLFDVTECENPAADALFYNMTFYIRTSEFGWRPIEVEGNSTGKVEYGHSGEDTVRLPPSQPGILMIAWSGVMMGEGRIDRVMMVPWGMGALGMHNLSLTFGGNPSSRSWVATELRQVTVGQISYQVKLAAWSEKGYQV
jgi:hypothetical protein